MRHPAAHTLSAIALGLGMTIAPLSAAPALANPASTTSQQAIEVVVQRALSQRGVPFVYGGGGASGPSAPAVPAAPRTFPATPVVPGAGGYPASPAVPGYPASPAVPGTSGFPASPAYPASPVVPGYPAAPAAPAAPVVPGYPAAVPAPATPGAGAYPVAPAAPAAPSAVGFDASGLVVYAYAGAGIKLPRSSGEQYATGRKVVPAQAQRGDLIFYGPGGSQSVALFLGNGQMVEVGDVVQVSPVRSNDMAPFLVRVIQ